MLEFAFRLNRNGNSRFSFSQCLGKVHHVALVAAFGCSAITLLASLAASRATPILTRSAPNLRYKAVNLALDLAGSPFQPAALVDRVALEAFALVTVDGQMMRDHLGMFEPLASLMAGRDRRGIFEFHCTARFPYPVAKT